MRMLEQAEASKVEIKNAYKSQRGTHWATYTSGKHKLVSDMELFIISTQGVSSRVVIWPMEKQDSLTSMVLTAACVPQKTTSTVGNVPEKGRHDAELVQMSSPRPGAGRRTTTER